MTRFRIGMVFGFAAGYYLGAKAGRERYETMNRALGRLRSSDAVGKLRAAVELGRERAHAHDTGPYVDLGNATAARN